MTKQGDFANFSKAGWIFGCFPLHTSMYNIFVGICFNSSLIDWLKHGQGVSTLGRVKWVMTYFCLFLGGGVKFP